MWAATKFVDISWSTEPVLGATTGCAAVAMAACLGVSFLDDGVEACFFFVFFGVMLGRSHSAIRVLSASRVAELACRLFRR